ncbi:unnamed protein product [Dovyalis caffra]|uniref:Wall-associated receptor kinase galacturonan-binding domain-containing protein n=1 Tax=Dovyalis caffra TaxID=77055 RepID=A0AAV1SEI1_9ROSI|nr:unnamed protein product [Dovyalis caffra]
MRILSVHLVVFLMVWLSASQAIAVSYEFTRCTRQCGNVEIPYPFGIEPQCYMDKSYEVTCNISFSPHKPFLTSINMELLQVSLREGQVRVNNPVISSNCSNSAPSRRVYNLSGSPFIYSNTSNRFTAMGCDNYARLSQGGAVVGGCLSMCDRTPGNTSGCYGLNCCQTIIPPQVKSFEANMTKILNNNDGEGCSSAFMVEQDWLNSKFLNDVQPMEYVPAILQFGTYQGFCDISKTSDVILCSFDGYCWNRLSQSHCICNGCQDNVDRCLDPGTYSCRLLLAMELEMIRASQGASSTIQEGYEEVDYTAGDIAGPWDTSSTATGSFFNSSTVSVQIDRQPSLL